MKTAVSDITPASRCRGALMGLFIGDALAMPERWVQGLKQPPPDLKSMPPSNSSEVALC